MIALDTNVLIRYLAQDDKRQAAIATRLIEKTLSVTNRGFVSLVALLETVWVMEWAYGADAASIADIVSDLLDSASLDVQDSASVRDALVRFSSGGVDLHDCLIVSLGARRAARTVTFDVKPSKRLGMELLR